jgi:hypothetical protein
VRFHAEESGNQLEEWRKEIAKLGQQIEIEDDEDLETATNCLMRNWISLKRKR